MYAGLGWAHDHLEHHERAYDAFERALELAPNAPRGLRYYAQGLAQREEQLDRALQLARRAVDNDSSSVEALGTLGWVHFKRGSLSKAQSRFESALARGDFPASVYDQFGSLHQALGNDSLTQRYWKKGLEYDPTRDTRNGTPE